MKKKQLTLVMAVLASLALTGCSNYKIALNDTNPVHVELGSELSTDAKDYITVTKGEDVISEGEVFEEITVDTSAVDTFTIGTYSLVIGYDDNEFIVPIVVEDTTAPVIEVSDLELEAGTKVTADEFVKATDLQEVTVYFILEDGTETNAFTFEGEKMDVTVAAEDAAGNISEKVFTIKPLVAEEPEEAEELEEDAAVTETSSTGTGTKAKSAKGTQSGETATGTSTGTGTAASATTGTGTTATNTPAQPSTPAAPSTPAQPAAPSNPGSGTTGGSNPADHVDMSDAAKKDTEEYSRNDPINNPAGGDAMIDNILDNVLNN